MHGAEGAVVFDEAPGRREFVGVEYAGALENHAVSVWQLSQCFRFQVGFEQVFVEHDWDELAFKVARRRILRYSNKQDAFFPALLHQHLQREQCQKRDVQRGQPVLFAVFGDFHGAGGFCVGCFGEEELESAERALR